ncbi:type VI secretion protein [Acinetobacter sp. ANC 4558]|uniref:type VI secretion system membrane subunit TssM n=1 Tax=Acinetobacter sp. ANC 4558 TaxID=1977876 RepID=UPI000A35325E|nr:type VI secretion system membrane subunit TssM [Acinetobacter sp. ANC 4558]OTG86379.1 type VI secretion protein [Acinetobacter sp. ANC 4558]
MYTILSYLWQYVTNPKAIIALSLFVALISTYNVIPRQIFWGLLVAYILGLICYGLYWLIQRKKHVENAEALEEGIEKTALISDKGESKNKEELQLINQQMKESIQLIKKSKLGSRKGNAALYELPWYMVIGNPAAGKSSAIYNSGLNFPFEDTHQKVISAGVSGTRNCDWFFSTEGILLDTAGRYSVYEHDHEEWLSFLGLLKKSRSKAPVNGVILVVNIAELVSQSPENSLKLAKNLRARIQDLTERLEVFAPVYLIFTKMDLIAGFTEFFDYYEQDEFDQVWGATLPYNPESSQKAIELFEDHYNVLYDGLKSVSTTHLSRRHAQNISPSVMTFPLEFKTLKPILKSFIGALFEENPYQFKPVFRGFYFTSALQEGTIESPMTELLAQEFELAKENSEANVSKQTGQNHGYFLKGLFSDVILKDRNLVKQHINPANKRKRFLAFIASLMAVSIILGGWLWSYRNNQQLITDVQADLNKVVQMESQSQDLTSQLEALMILQNRLQQLEALDHQHFLKFGLGLYQGDMLYEKLKAEYLSGVKQIILIPAQHEMSSFLQAVQQNSEKLKENHSQVEIKQVSMTQQYAAPSDSNPQDAYNALKAYLMLTNPQYRESSHLADQITRFWRSNLDASNTDNIAKAEQILTYSMSFANDKAFPILDSDSQLVDQARQVLLSVVRGMPARDRVYNEIKMRASVRYPALTVAQIVGEKDKNIILGGHAVPGMFTQQAWDEYVKKAIEDAADNPTDTKDWVLNSRQSDDLTFSGSPDQIRKQLIQVYKQDYIKEWKQFLNSIHYAKGTDFNNQVKIIDVLGDTQSSPIWTLIERIAKETNWDDPVVQAELAVPQKGFIAWFKRKVLRQGVETSIKNAAAQGQGTLAKQFQVFYQLVRKRDDLQDKSLLDEYLENLAAVRSKLGELKNSGDIGPSAMALVKLTLNEQTSVFNQTDKVVNEKLSSGLNDSDRQTIQKLLVSPVLTTFNSLIAPTQDELNKLWMTQAYQPFSQTLASKYPFTSSASIQATSTDIGQIFGESGSIARYVKETLDPFIIRRGYILTSKTWKDLGVSLNPQFAMNFQTYVAPLNGVATGSLDQPSQPSAASQSNFQFYPIENPQLVAYIIDIDGQRMNYENGVQQWVNFIWPNPQAIPGARITVIDRQGETHTIFDAPGEYGINRLINSATRTDLGNGIFEMKWISQQDSNLYINVKFRLISGSSGGSRGANFEGLKLVDQVATANSNVRIVAAEKTTNQTNLGTAK